MDDGLGLESRFQHIIDTIQVFLARTDHPLVQSAATDRNPGALKDLRQTIERRAVDIFMNEREGQRRSGGDAAWKAAASASAR